MVISHTAATVSGVFATKGKIAFCASGYSVSDFYEEGSVGTIKTPAVPTPAEQWDNTSDSDPRDVNEWRPLIKSNFLSNGAKFTPTGDISSGKPVIEVTGLKWNTDFDVKVPGFYCDGGITADKTIREAYYIQSDGKLYGSGNNTSSTSVVDAFAIVPVEHSGGIRYFIVFRGTDSKLYSAANGNALNAAGFDFDGATLKFTSK